MSADPDKKRDFTLAQCRRWIAQEAAKHVTRESRAERIISERRTLAMAKEYALEEGFPRQIEMHHRLIAVLIAEIEKDAS